VLTGQNAVEIKIENDLAYGRLNETQEWQKIEKFTDLFAPNNDPLAYLAAMKNVQAQGAQSYALDNGAQVTAARYTFEVNGLTFAEFMRNQAQTELERTGKWPVGLDMDVMRQYVDMQGTGQVWLNGEGLPMRQVVDLKFPAQPGASDWVVHALNGKYPDEEAYFLNFILHFFEESLTGHAELDAGAFANWLKERRAQIERGELVYIAHQMDFLAKV
jgi:hypothetical protein